MKASGPPSAMTRGTSTTPRWFVGNSVTLRQSPPNLRQNSGKARDQSDSMTSNATETSRRLPRVPMVAWEYITADTLKTQGLLVLSMVRTVFVGI